MSDHLAAAAAAIGIPEDLAQRSAEARAAADGVSTDDILAAWAGGTAAPATAAPPPAPEPAPAVAPGEDEPVPAEVGAALAPSAAEVPAAASTAIAHPSAPARVTGAEAFDYDAVVTVPTAGLAERTTSATPRWLVSLFLAIPLIGLVYLVTFANGPTCGSGGQLEVDRLTGAAVNCDGTAFAAAGSSGGVDIRGLIAEGESLYAAAPGNCTSCHGSAGGGGTGPALAGQVLSTFSACADHVEWVALATTGFQAAGRTTYGDSDLAVGGGGVMVGYEGILTPEQLAAVVFYERVQFGGQDPDEAATDCGLAEPETDEAPAEEATALGG